MATVTLYWRAELILPLCYTRCKAQFQENRIMIVNKGKGNVELKTKDGSRTLGKHKSRAAALRQERAIYANKDKKNSRAGY